jgi:hypothetical protein
MQPIFERLRELQILPMNLTEETESSDTTLIAELESLIESNLDQELDDLRREESEDTGLGTIEEDNVTSDGAITVPDFLSRCGGSADLEDFIRSLAKGRGFQRLGRKVRKDIESEIQKLVRLGKVSVDNDVVSLKIESNSN